MASPAVLKIDIISDTKGRGFRDTETNLQKLNRTALKAAAAITGVLAVGVAKATAAAEKGATANARLDNVLKQMTGDTGKASAAAKAHAEALAKVTGVDDDVIKGGQAILATFQSVADTAGRTGGTFDRATQAAVDLAATGFGSVESNATSLGKALEDPIAGLSALRRQGITFTEEQQNLIASLVESGDQLGAQTLILDAIEKQVGGTAEATANATDKMGESWDEIMEVLGQAVLPIIDLLADKLAGATEWVQKNQTAVLAIIGTLAGFAAAVFAVNAALKVYQAVTAVIAVATKVWTGIQAAFNLVMSLNPVGLVVLAIAALVAIIVTAYQRSETFRKIVQKVGDVLKNVLVGAFNAVKNAVKAVVDWFRQAIDWIGELFDKIKSGPLGGIINTIGNIFGGAAPEVWFHHTGPTGAGYVGRLYYPPGPGTGGAGAAPVGGRAGAGRRTTITIRGSANPQQLARDLSSVLTGAYVRTGYKGIRP
jgi:hypothetical protein